MAKLSPAFKKINKKQRKFVKEYARTGNLTQSALEAYDTDKKTSAASIGSRLVKKPHIQDAIEEALDKTGMSAEWILEQKKKLIDKGMNDLQDAKVSPEVVNKSLDSLLKLYSSVDKSSLVNNKSIHLHQHLHQATRDEVLKKRQESVNWFNEIIDQD